MPKRNEKSYLIEENEVEQADDERESIILEDNYAATKRRQPTRSSGTEHDNFAKRTRKHTKGDEHEVMIPIVPKDVTMKEVTQSPEVRDHMQLATSVLPGDTIRAADVRKAKVFLCSIEQFENSVKGYRTESKRLATKKQRKPADNKTREAFVMDEVVIPTGLGAPRVTARVEGKYKTMAILDGGSTSSIMSLDLIKALGVTQLHKSNCTHGMADGRKIDAVGVAKGITIEIGGVQRIVDVAVFERPDYDLLIGRKALHSFGINTDWARYHWSIQKDKGVVPLQVSYQGAYGTPRFAPATSSEETSSDSSESYSETEESYFLVPVGQEEEEANNKQFVTAREDIREEVAKAARRNDLTTEQRKQLEPVLRKYLDVFGLNYRDLTQTTLVKLHIDTGDAKPIMKRPNRFMSHSELDSLKKEIEEMVDQGLLVPTSHKPLPSGARAGGWAFPALYVKKKNGEKRLCVQFQDLNAVTVRDPWPLPRISDLLEDYQGACWFTTVDLLKGFNQIAVDDETVPKLTMAVPWGNFSFVVMPFGIVNGPSTFARAIYLAMQEFLGEFVSTYIDDITIYSKTFEEHLIHVEKVLHRLREVNMKISPRNVFSQVGRSRCSDLSYRTRVSGHIRTRLERSRISATEDADRRSRLCEPGGILQTTCTCVWGNCQSDKRSFE